MQGHNYHVLFGEVFFTNSLSFCIVGFMPLNPVYFLFKKIFVLKF